MSPSPYPCECCPVSGTRCVLTGAGLAPVFPCRRRNGTLEWYDLAGNLVPAASVVDCATAFVPFVLGDLRLTGGAFGDGPDSLGENLCNVAPAPVATTGFTPTGACYDPTVGNPTMTWGPTSTVTLEYGNPPRTSGGVFITFASVALGLITWPTNNTGMAPGEARVSNVFDGTKRAVLTYLSGPPSGVQSIRMTGGSTLALHFATTDNVTPPIRWRLDLLQPAP
ncbi:hypothetical protein [Streptomyces sp. NPDC057250]|uniref:hypothetical protein n=1 Tax=Streptomyces sp. NPDC057250 TaxID=3346068 RepID=UPI00362B53FE